MSLQYLHFYPYLCIFTFYLHDIMLHYIKNQGLFLHFGKNYWQLKDPEKKEKKT